MWDLHTSTPYPAHATNIRGVHCELLSFLQLALRQQLCLGLCYGAKLSCMGNNIHHLALFVEHHLIQMPLLHFLLANQLICDIIHLFLGLFQFRMRYLQHVVLLFLLRHELPFK
jgi:hypothetical protein